MKALVAVAFRVQTALDAAGVPNCVIGGLAVARWGEARLTKDVDVSAFTGIGGETRAIDCVLRICKGRTSDPRAFALRHRTLVVEADEVPIDISLAALPFEERMMQRASAAEYAPGVSLRTASAEDLVTMKVFVRRELAELEALAERAEFIERFDAICATVR